VISIYEEMMERLKADGVPEAMADALSELDKEVAGFWDAEGWKKPKDQAEFIAKRLKHYLGKFTEMAE